MKSLRTSVFLLAALILGTFPAFAQGEKLSTADATQVAVERHRGFTEDISARPEHRSHRRQTFRMARARRGCR